MIDLVEGLNKLGKKQTRAIRERLASYEGVNYWNHQKDCTTLRDYRFGKQYLKEELDARAKNGKGTLTLNRMRKILNGMVGIKTANKPKFNVVPHNGEDSAISDLYGKLLDTSFQTSKGMDVLRNVVMYGDGDNIGYFFVRLNDKGIPIFEALDYTQVVVDPKSSDSLFRDAECIYIKKWIPIERAKILYGIDDFDTSTPSYWDRDDLFSTNSTNIDIQVGRMIDTSKQNVKVYEGYVKYIEVHNGSVRTRIRKESIVGYHYIYKKDLPEYITDYPIIPYYVDYVPNPYRTGDGHTLKEIQDYINSAINITIEGARRNSNPETFLTEDMVDGDIEAWKEQYGSGERYFMIKKDRNGALPHTVQGQPLNQAWFGLLNFFLSEQEFLSVPDQILGFGDSSEKVRTDMIMKREAVMDSMKLALGHLDSAISQLGTVIIQYYRAYVSPDRTLYITSGKEKIERYTMRKRAGLDLDSDDSINRYKSYRLKQGDNPNQVDVDISKAKADKAFYDSLQSMYNPMEDDAVDVHVVSGSYNSSYAIQQFDRLMTMRQAGLHIDDEYIIKKAPVEDSTSIAERASMNRSLMSENEQYRHLVEELKAQISQLQGIVAQGKMQSTQEKYEYKLRKQVDDIKNKGYVRKKTESFVTNANIKATKVEGRHEIELLKERLKVLEAEAKAEIRNEVNKSKQTEVKQPLTVSDLLGV